MRESFWFMPAVYSIIAMFLVALIYLADDLLATIINDDLLKQLNTEKDTAKKLYGTLVTAILTMTTLSYSVIMVVLTTYSSQFSPRILQNFMKSRFTQHVLGIYCLGFILALLLLFLVDHGELVIGPVIMVAIAIINLGAFVYFIHHSARFLQVNNLIANLKNEGSRVIEQLYKKSDQYKRHSNWNEVEVRKLKEKRKTIITAKRSGYIQNIQLNGLINWATRKKGVIELHIHPGDFIPIGLPLMTVWSEEELGDHIHSFLVIGNERSDIQDFEFIIQKIEEIALRAISSSANDPHTTINCVHRIGTLLIELGNCYEQTPYLADMEDRLRIIHESMSYEYYLYKCFYQIRYYGQNDVSTIYGILDVLYKIAVVSSPEIKQKIWKFHFYITDVVEWDELAGLDQQHLKEVYDRLETCCVVTED